jgi:hypothetical protein
MNKINNSYSVKSDHSFDIELWIPHSAPPSVTIGNFGFLNTFNDNFDTESSKSWVAIANLKSPNDHFSLCDSLGCGRWDRFMIYQFP